MSRLRKAGLWRCCGRLNGDCACRRMGTAADTGYRDVVGIPTVCFGVIPDKPMSQ